MAFTGTARDALFRTAADPVPIRGSVGMDAGAVAGKRDAVLGDKPVLKGGEEGGKAEDLLEPFLIMEGEFRVVQGISRQLIRDAGMLIGKLFPFAGLFWKAFHFYLLGKGPSCRSAGRLRAASRACPSGQNKSPAGEGNPGYSR